MLRTTISILAASLLLIAASPDRDEKGAGRTWGVVRDSGHRDGRRDGGGRDRVAQPERRERKHDRTSAWSSDKQPPRHSDGGRVTTRVIRSHQDAEKKPNHYYWHEDHGVRYSHYYDGRRHWYGFRHDSRFYWTRLHRDRWWWYDANDSRWVYWYNGLWWWPGPGGVPYAYIDDGYYPYEAVPAMIAQAPAAPAAPAANAGYVSPDGKRQVQIAPDGAATLYDLSSGAPRYMTALASGVQRVTFGGGTSAEPLRILLELKTGGFSLYDADGRELDIMSAAGKPAEPPQDVPDSLPPIPTSAPGE